MTSISSGRRVQGSFGKGAIFEENEVIRLVAILTRPTRPTALEDHFEINTSHSSSQVIEISLHEKGWMAPVTRGAGERIVQYELTRGGLDSMRKK